MEGSWHHEDAKELVEYYKGKFDRKEEDKKYKEHNHTVRTNWENVKFGEEDGLIWDGCDLLTTNLSMLEMKNKIIEEFELLLNSILDLNKDADIVNDEDM